MLKIIEAIALGTWIVTGIYNMVFIYQKRFDRYEMISVYALAWLIGVLSLLLEVLR